jgi:26S proteasome regulatory subunit N5
VTRILSNLKKEQGDIKAATDILCELQVETFGSMTRREKTDFILEQVALCIEKGDWVQAAILSRKISTRYFARRPKKTPEELEKAQKAREEAEKNRNADDPPIEPEDDVTDLKLRYYEQQLSLAKHESKYLDACKYYRQVLDTEAVEQNPEQLKEVCIRQRLCVILANPTGTETRRLLCHSSPARQRTVRPAPTHQSRYSLRHAQTQGRGGTSSSVHAS